MCAPSVHACKIDLDAQMHKFNTPGTFADTKVKYFMAHKSLCMLPAKADVVKCNARTS